MINGQATSVSDHERAAKYLAVVPTATEGGRNDALNKTAFLFAETFNLPESQFTALLSDWAGRFNPPLPEHEVATTIQSAWRGAQSKGVAGSKARPQSGRARPYPSDITDPSTGHPDATTGTHNHLRSHRGATPPGTNPK